MNNLTIQDVLANKENYNLALPFTETRQVNPFYKISVAPVYFSADWREGQVFKVGSRSKGNDQWEDLYTLTKPSLQRLATEAGIQFPQGSGDVVKMDENTWKATSFGMLQLPDGTVRTDNNFKIIDLVMEERKYRLAYEEKAEKGIADYKAAKEASGKYAGKWVETNQKNERGYAVKIYVIDKQDRERYIESSLINAMAQLRADAPQKAATGALLRVIRNLIGLKGTYTRDELKKPFAVARMSFSPDYNDPLIKQMMLQRAMQSMGNLFGSGFSTANAVSATKIPDAGKGADIPVELNDTYDGSSPVNNAEEAAGQEDTDGVRNQDFYCDKCGTHITEKVWDYSVDKFGRPLCYKCQKGERR
ncbi:MAG: hypothetical protein HFH59_09430 [Lachnospiraceae bacterium]|jgi:hypothetical protein|nr:hypothetical protein [Lachnospiraceae bacterium]MCI9357743.1 hypothetical protein [Lachnospiraceae bacterium]